MARKSKYPEGFSVAEAGRLGGRATKKRHGPAHYQRIGKMGGETTKQTHGPQFYERIGRKGGARMKELAALGRKAEGGE